MDSRYIDEQGRLRDAKGHYLLGLSEEKMEKLREARKEILQELRETKSRDRIDWNLLENLIIRAA